MENNHFIRAYSPDPPFFPSEIKKLFWSTSRTRFLPSQIFAAENFHASLSVINEKSPDIEIHLSATRRSHHIVFEYVYQGYLNPLIQIIWIFVVGNLLQRPKPCSCIRAQKLRFITMEMTLFARIFKRTAPQIIVLPVTLFMFRVEPGTCSYSLHHTFTIFVQLGWHRL